MLPYTLCVNYVLPCTPILPFPAVSPLPCTRARTKVETLFDALDSNNDGVVDLNEMSSGIEAVKQQVSGSSGDNRGGTM